MKKRILAMVLTITCSLALAACGDKEKDYKEKHDNSNNGSDTDISIEVVTGNSDEELDDSIIDIEEPDIGDDKTVISSFEFDTLASYDWQFAYKSMLDEIRSARSTQDMSFMGNETTDICEYCLYDVDKNDIPELFVKYGCCEADYNIDIYKYDEDKKDCELLLNDPFGHSSLCTCPDENGVLFVNGHMGFMSVCKFCIDGDSYTMEQIFEEELDDYESDYTKIDEIVPGSEYISFGNWSVDLPIIMAAGKLETACMDNAVAEEIFKAVIEENGDIFPVDVTYYREPYEGKMSFNDFLAEGNLDMYNASNMTDYRFEDLNGDGQEECVVGFDTSNIMILSIQSDEVYAYCCSYYSYDDIVSITDGLFTISEYDYIVKIKVEFYGEQAVLEYYDAL